MMNHYFLGQLPSYRGSYFCVQDQGRELLGQCRQRVVRVGGVVQGVVQGAAANFWARVSSG